MAVSGAGVPGIRRETKEAARAGAAPDPGGLPDWRACRDAWLPPADSGRAIVSSGVSEAADRGVVTLPMGDRSIEKS